MGGSRNRYARGEDSEPRTEAIAAMIAEHTPPALIPRPRRPDRPAAGRWPYTPHFEFMSPAASPAWMAARAAVAELSEADGRLLKDLILRRPRGTDQAPAAHPEAWLIAPAKIDALLDGREHLRVAFIAWLAAIGVSRGVTDLEIELEEVAEATGYVSTIAADESGVPADEGVVDTP